METAIRKAFFAGKFYPESKEELEHLFHFMVKVETNKMNTEFASNRILGAIVPHAGYIYSGYHAVHVYQLLKLCSQKFETIVIINPNHTGNGTGHFNLSNAMQWETPLGKLQQDKAFLDELDGDYNDTAHEQEHSGEVQLPFLQHFLNYSFKIVMITMNQQNPENAMVLANKIFQATQKTKRKILVIASSDFSHYENAETGFKKDQYLIDQILNFNTTECYQQVKKQHITACGYGPIMTMLEYLKLASFSPKIEILRRGHSGEVSSSNRVVDYVSFLGFEK